MKKALLIFFGLMFTACSVLSPHIKKQHSYKCYINGIKAPFWMCRRNDFVALGAVKTKSKDILSEELAYTKAIQNLIFKLQKKVSLLLKKLHIKKKNFLKDVKAYVIINSYEKGSWFDKKNHTIYAAAEIEKKSFEDFLEYKLKVDKKKFKELFNENF